jgi:hypothetical protein
MVADRTAGAGRSARNGKERLIVETDDPPRKVRVEVCGKCVAHKVLAPIARRVAREGPGQR